MYCLGCFEGYPARPNGRPPSRTCGARIPRLDTIWVLDPHQYGPPGVFTDFVYTPQSVLDFFAHF